MRSGSSVAAWRSALIVAMLALVACAPEKPTPHEDATAPPPASSAALVSGRMRVLDWEGNALEHMVPIATEEPNAFDQPIATGPSTDGKGESRITFPGDVWLCLRAWDPKLDYFPNNFYDVIPNTGDVAEEMTIEMVPAAGLVMALRHQDDTPAANENVALMMVHPTRGPWWPAEADTTAEGLATFAHIPPGAFTLRIKTESSGLLEIPEIAIPPGQTVDLGLRTLP